MRTPFSKMCRRLAAPSIGCAAVVLVGCANPAIEPKPQCDFNAYKQALQAAPPSAGPVLVTLPVGAVSDMPLNTVNITDVAITNKVMVQATNAKRLPSGQIETYARLVNCTDFALQVEGRTHFLNETQAPVEGATAWKRVYLPPRSIGHYDSRSTMTDQVATYLIEIREGT
jgi:hypothetical protein